MRCISKHELETEGEAKSCGDICFPLLTTQFGFLSAKRQFNLSGLQCRGLLCHEKTNNETKQTQDGTEDLNHENLDEAGRKIM
jgi:hypothetical protein